MKDYAETLRYANLTIALIERTRAKSRLQESYRRLREVKIEGTGWVPPEYGRAVARFEDDVYFLVVALRRVSRGREQASHPVRTAHQVAPQGSARPA